MNDDFNANLKSELDRTFLDDLMSELPPELAHLRGEATDLCATLGQDAAEAWVQSKYNQWAVATGEGTRYSDGQLIMAGGGDLIAENTALCNSARMPIREFYSPERGSIRMVGETTGKKTYTAKIAHANKINKNRRIYPDSVLRANLSRLQPKLAGGYLIGGVDHASSFEDGGALKSSCLIWRSLNMDSSGAVMGEFEVTEHSAGRDLSANIDAGMAVGFSLLGHGTAHSPSAAERTEYGLPAGEHAVVMNPDYQMQRIDCVDDPSVEDARLLATA